MVILKIIRGAKKKKSGLTPAQRKEVARLVAMQKKRIMKDKMRRVTKARFATKPLTLPPLERKKKSKLDLFPFDTGL